MNFMSFVFRGETAWLGASRSAEGNWTEQELNEGWKADLDIASDIIDLTNDNTWIVPEDIIEENKTGKFTA